MRWFRSLFSQTWMSFVVFCVCLGFLADFPIGRDKLENSVNAIHPILAALLPYIAMFGVIYGSGLAGRWLFLKSVDFRNDASSVRKFQALGVRIGNCKRDLISHLEDPYLSFRPFSNASHEAQLMGELEFVLGQLKQLGIPVPDFMPLKEQYQWQALVTYLATMQQLAKNGYLKRPRSPSEKHGWRVFGGMMGPVQ